MNEQSQVNAKAMQQVVDPSRTCPDYERGEKLPESDAAQVEEQQAKQAAASVLKAVGAKQPAAAGEPAQEQPKAKLTSMATLAGGSWHALEAEVVAKIRLLAQTAASMAKDDSPVGDEIAHDLILPNLKLLAMFCENIKIEGQGDDLIEQMGAAAAVSEKYAIGGNRIINRASGRPVAGDEPVFILRGQDRNAVRTLHYYRGLCIDPDHKEAVKKVINLFSRFRGRNPQRIKEPDTRPSTHPGVSSGGANRSGDASVGRCSGSGMEGEQS